VTEIEGNKNRGSCWSHWKEKCLRIYS